MYICPVCKNKVEYVFTSDRWECTECNWCDLFIEDIDKEGK